MKTILITLVLTIALQLGYSQNAYIDSLNKFISNYVETHEVVTGNDKKFLSFYPVDEQYHIKARFEKADNVKWFNMRTSGGRKDINRIYGTVYFTIRDTAVQLNLYQSQDLMNVTALKDYLFLPFTDLTTGVETYDGGRYIDLHMSDIVNNSITIDFNKAYNPYCAYVSGKYDCPIPPKENTLMVAIKSGEKAFGKKH